MRREIICIGCPMGCRIAMESENGGVTVRGNACPRGERYARQELLAPMRTVTGTVPIVGENRRVAVKTSKPIPKERIFEVMRAIHACEAKPSAQIGDILIPNVCGTEADIIASSNT